MAKITSLKKITPQQVGFDPGAIDWKEQKAEVFVLRIVGIAKSLRPYTAPSGDKAYGLRGVFKATGPDGKVYQSGVYYPPGYIQEQVEPLITDADDFEGVKIAGDVFCKPSANKRAGSSPYEYVFTSLVEVEEQDVITEMEASLPALPVTNAVKALPKPLSKKK